MGHLYQQGNSRRYNWPSMLSPFNTCRLDTSLKITHLEMEWIRKEDSDWKHKATTASFQLWRGTNFVKNVWLAETIQTNLVQKFCPTFLGIVVTPPNSLCKYESAENSSIVIMLWGISGQMQPWINVPHEHLTASGCTVQLQLVDRPMCGSSQYIRL